MFFFGSPFISSLFICSFVACFYLDLLMSTRNTDEHTGPATAHYTRHVCFQLGHLSFCSCLSLPLSSLLQNGFSRASAPRGAYNFGFLWHSALPSSRSWIIDLPKTSCDTHNTCSEATVRDEALYRVTVVSYFFPSQPVDLSVLLCARCFCAQRKRFSACVTPRLPSIHLFERPPDNPSARSCSGCAAS